MRGVLTPEVKATAKRLLDWDLTQVELRLIPYIQYVMVNEQRLEPVKINAEERRYLAEWKARGWITGGIAPMEISKPFWDAIHEILWQAYVTCDEG